MGEHSGISWTDHTFNPWVGCTKVSAGCDHCYAEGWGKRSGIVEWGPHAVRARTSEATWHQPRKWNARAEASGRRERVFCASLADVFDNHRSIHPWWRDELWALIQETPHLDWQLLTKRPQNIAGMLPDDWGPGGYPNVWLGTTAENQAEADRRIDRLFDVPARLRFLSCEPLLGRIDLTALRLTGTPGEPDLRFDVLTGRICPWFMEWDEELDDCASVAAIDWVIVGGESGPGSRPMHPDWARSLRDQCAEAGVPFHFKQHGDWLAGEFVDPPEILWQNGNRTDKHQLPDFDGPGLTGWNDGLGFVADCESHVVFRRVGKKAAGRRLDGLLHDGDPEIAS